MFETHFSDLDHSALSTGFPSSQGLGSNLIPNLLPTGTQLVNPRSIAFVDLNVPDVEHILQNLTADVIIPLSPKQDSITQITETLSHYDDLLGVHVISHGSSGQLMLGDSVVNLQTLNSRSQDLQTWANALTPDADILLYGCNVAEGTVGSTFVSRLGQLTGADVAASTDITGNVSHSGNWDLEYATGTIESSLAIQPSLLNTYNGVLGSLNYGGSTGLIGYWKFEKAAGNTVLDSSGNNNKGSLINSSRTVGIYGQALQVSGKSNSYTNIPASASLNSITNKLTISAWVRPNGQPVGFHSVVNRQIGTLLHPDQFFLGFGKKNNVTTYKWEIGTTNGEASIYKGLPIANRWVHMVGTYDGSMIRLYVNGVQIGGSSLTGNILVDNNPVTIGAAENYSPGTPLGDRFNGLIDEVRIYNRALSATEIKKLP